VNRAHRVLYTVLADRGSRESARLYDHRLESLPAALHKFTQPR
jgi:hypothetical protein